MRNSSYGKVLAIVILAISLFLYYLSKVNEGGLDSRFIYLYLGQLAAILSVTFIFINFVLATRVKFLEMLFGGLDKLFIFHKFSGKMAWFLILFHPILVFWSSIMDGSVLKIYLDSNYSHIYRYGTIALFSLSVIILFTLLNILPYHVWKLLHRCMIVPLIFIFLHVYNIPSDVAVFMPLRYWILSLIFVAFSAYIYKQIFYEIIGPVYKYNIQSIKQIGKITEFVLTPENKKIIHKAGQFVYLKVIGSNSVSTETHPFTISSFSRGGSIRISAKQSGDYTTLLPNVKLTSKVKLYGPYGTFGRDFMPKCKKEIWIAGGIGITPFLSMLNSLTVKNDPEKEIYFFYAFNSEQEGYYNDEINRNIQKLSNVKYFKSFSNFDGRVDVKLVKDKAGDFSNTNFLICGPHPMMKSLEKQFKDAGVSGDRIFYEEFSLK